MAIDTSKFINYAARSIPRTQIAAAFGITPGRVTQLLDNPKVARMVEDKKKEIALAELEDQSSISDARTRLLNRLPDLIESTDSLSEAVGALEKITRLGSHSPTPQKAQPLISLELPDFLKTKLTIELSSQNEIVEIDGRSMATMPTTETRTLLKTHGQDPTET